MTEDRSKLSARIRALAAALSRGEAEKPGTEEDAILEAFDAGQALAADLVDGVGAKVHAAVDSRPLTMLGVSFLGGVVAGMVARGVIAGMWRRR